MVANLGGIAFQQIYADNSGSMEFDTDGDGTASQEDEFVSVINTTGAPIDVSGWQIWSDSTGAGAPDTPQDGLYHTFPPGTVIAPGDSLYVINEISDPNGRYFAQEASEGGSESGAGGTSTNLLTEGSSDSSSEAVYLVDPATGDYIVFNMSSGPPNTSTMPGFPGTSQVGIVDGHGIQDDPGAGSSYQYRAATDDYSYDDAYVPCFLPGTRIDTADGPQAVETLAPGDRIRTHDGRIARVKAVLRRTLDLRGPANDAHRPIRFAPGALGPDRPDRALSVSPQHRMLIARHDGTPVLVPAKALLHRRGVRRRMGLKQVQYIHLLLERHEVITANNTPSESFWPAAYGRRHLPPSLRRHVDDTGDIVGLPPILTVREARALAT